MRIGFIGLGNMGGPMALNVLKAGHTMVVTDVRRELATPHLAQGAAWAATPKAVAQASEIVFTSLPGPREVEAVALGPGGILEGAARGTVYVDLSTSSATLIRHIQRVYAERGVDVLDAPVSGGVPRGAFRQACGAGRRGRGALPAGQARAGRHRRQGDPRRRDRVWHRREARPQHGVGVFPHGHRGSFGQGRVLNDMIPNTVFAGAFDTANFALELLRKDVGLATALGREYHVPMLIAALAEQQLEEALQRGWDDKDSMAIFCLQEERAGVQLRTERG